MNGGFLDLYPNSNALRILSTTTELGGLEYILSITFSIDMHVTGAR
jgi:hypothetical protein